MKKLVIPMLALVLSLAVAAPAFATVDNGTGYEYGQHHSTHAQEMGGFSGTMNPGLMHRGFSGWMGL